MDMQIALDLEVLMTIQRPPWSERSDNVRSAQPAYRALPEHLAYLWQQGGWDSRLAPRDAWRRVLGDEPYPGPLDLATQPTFGPLDAWLDDPTITDVHLNGPGRELITRRSGDGLELGMRETWYPEWYLWLVQQLRARGRGKATDVQLHGTADATRPGRRPCVVRYEVALPPLCQHGPVLTIRVLRPGQLSLQRLIELEMLSAPAAEFLACCMRATIDIVIVGTAGAGKTTLAQALLDTVIDQRIICVEDIPEIVIEYPRTIHLDLAAVEGVTFAGLIRAALHMNAERIVVGETRGAEAYAVLAAARNGYPILTTMHGDSALHGLHNLAAMALEATETQASLEVVYATLNARPMLVVALMRRDGKRQVAEVVELQRQLGAARPTIEPLYERYGGAFVRLTRPSHALHERLEAAGALPKEVEQ
jgi:pilus assembly protein CpaF